MNDELTARFELSQRKGQLWSLLTTPGDQGFRICVLK